MLFSRLHHPNIVRYYQCWTEDAEEESDSENEEEEEESEEDSSSLKNPVKPRRNSES